MNVASTFNKLRQIFNRIKFVSKLIHVRNPSHFQLNIIYLLFLVPGGMFVAIVIAVFEFTWKQRKLAVDENVSNNSIKLSCTYMGRNRYGIFQKMAS